MRDKKRDRSAKASRKKRLFSGDGLQKRIKTSQQKSEGRRSNIFPQDKNIPLYRPADGSHIIDIIPYLAGKHDPATEEGNPTYTFEYQVHPNVGPSQKQYICPAMYDKKCPICEYRQKLRDKDDDRYKEYFPKQRNLYNVIVHDDKKEKKKGIQIWDVAWFYFEKHLMAISRKPSRAGREEKTVNFADPIKGKSISFTIEKPKSKDDFPSFVGHSFDDRDYEIDDDILDETFVLDDIVIVAPYEEIKDAFYGEDGSPSNKSSNGSNENEKDEDDIQSLLGELEDIDDMDDLEEFVDNNDLSDSDFDEDGKLRKEKKKVKKFLEEMLENLQDNSGEKESEYDRSDIEDMSYKELKKLIKEKDLDVDLDDFDKKDEDDMESLKEEVCDELGIED